MEDTGNISALVAAIVTIITFIINLFQSKKLKETEKKIENLQNKKH